VKNKLAVRPSAAAITYPSHLIKRIILCYYYYYLIFIMLLSKVAIEWLISASYSGRPRFESRSRGQLS
jgi:hypothetical protein